MAEATTFTATAVAGLDGVLLTNRKARPSFADGSTFAMMVP
jgi:hypothetical protein